MYLKVLKFILMNLWYLVRWLGLAMYHDSYGALRCSLAVWSCICSRGI